MELSEPRTVTLTRREWELIGAAVVLAFGQNPDLEYKEELEKGMSSLTDQVTPK